MMPLSLLAAVADTSDESSSESSSLSSHPHHKMSTIEPESEQSLKQRLARKAQLARESRRRKKSYIHGLEEQISALKRQVEQLQSALRQQNCDDSSVASSGTTSTVPLQTLNIQEGTSSVSPSSVSVKLHFNDEVRRIRLLTSHITLSSLREKAVAYWPYIGHDAVVSIMSNGVKQSISSEKQLSTSVSDLRDVALSVHLSKSGSTCHQAASPITPMTQVVAPFLSAVTPFVLPAQPTTLDECIDPPASKKLRASSYDVSNESLPVVVPIAVAGSSIQVKLQIVQATDSEGPRITLSQTLLVPREMTLQNVRGSLEQSLGTSLQDFVFVVTCGLVQQEQQLVSSLIQPQQVLLLCQTSLLIKRDN